MIAELVYTPRLNGIYTTFGLFLAMVYVPLCERILFKLRMVYIPVTEQTSLVYIPPLNWFLRWYMYHVMSAFCLSSEWYIYQWLNRRIDNIRKVYIPPLDWFLRWYMYHFMSAFCLSYTSEWTDELMISEMVYIPLWIDSSNGICTTYERILWEPRMVYIPVLFLWHCRVLEWYIYHFWVISRSGVYTTLKILSLKFEIFCSHFH